MPDRRWLLRALVAGAALAGAVFPSATAGAGTPPSTWLHLSVSPGGAPGGAARTADLTCDPPGGTDRNAVAACADLRATDGDIDAVRTTGHVCPMIYEPVTAQARGTWQGRRVDFTATYPNECQLRTRTGAIFQFSGGSPG